jgi:hypothetical protein
MAPVSLPETGTGQKRERALAVKMPVIWEEWLMVRGNIRRGD